MGKLLTSAEYAQLQAYCTEGLSLIDRAICLARARDWHTHAAEVTRARDRLLTELLTLQTYVTVEGQSEPEAPRLRLVHDAAHVHARAANQAGDGPGDHDVGGDYSGGSGEAG